MRGKIRVRYTSEFVGDNLQHGMQYAFFHKPNYPSLAPKWYQKLLASARKSVDIWDPYFNYDTAQNDDDTKLFAYLTHPVEVRFLMVDDKNSFETRMRNSEPQIANIIPAGIKNGMNISFSYISTGVELEKMWEFHDRYLIIDSERVFLVGSSVGYHLVSKATTGMCELYDESDKRLIIDRFDDYWTFSDLHHHVKKLSL